jgi:hypothetical protein
MSGITMFVIAPQEDIDAISNHGWPIKKWVGCEGYKYFGSDELGLLHSAVFGTPETHDLFPVLTCGDYGMIHPVPVELIETLAGADDVALAGFASGWAAGLTKVLDKRYRPDDLLVLLKDVRKVAAEAHRLGQPMFVWHGLE